MSSHDTEHDIVTFARLIWRPGDVREIRAIRGKTDVQTGYFDSPEAFAEAAATLDSRGMYNIYATVNPCDPALLARAQNRLRSGRNEDKSATSDGHISQRVLLPIDIDPVRVADVSASDAEKQEARQVARRVYRFLRERQIDSNSLLMVDSGNGFHIYMATALPNDAESKPLVQRVLQTLDQLFSSTRAKVDTTTANAARLMKVPGTTAHKGDNTRERPHRPCRLPKDVPSELVPVTAATLRSVAAMYAEPEIMQRVSDHAQHGVDLLDEILSGPLADSITKRAALPDGGYKVEFHCPWNDEHRGNGYAGRRDNGAYFAGCNHASCTWTWAELRAKFDPMARHQSHEHNCGDALLLPSAARATTGNRFLSIEELYAQPDQETEWLVEGLLPMSGTSIVVAKPKVGKSVTAQNLAVAVAQGAAFLGRRTRKGPVLYLALEEKQAEVKRHLRGIGARSDDPLFIYCAAAPEGAMDWLSQAARSYDPALIIIDTWHRLTRVRDTNDYALVNNAMEPLVSLARESGAHLSFTHHGRKGEGKDGDAVLGSTALFAAVDTLIEMRRSSERRTISSIQRYGEDLTESVIAMDVATFRVSLAGTRKVADEREAAKAIITFLMDQSDPVTREDIEASVEARTGSIRDALKSLVEGGHVTRAGEGKRGSPYLYLAGDVSCFLVPTIYGEQENKNQTTLTFPPGDARDACSRIADVIGPSDQTWEQQIDQAAPEHLADDQGWEAVV